MGKVKTMAAHVNPNMTERDRAYAYPSPPHTCYSALGTVPFRVIYCFLKRNCSPYHCPV